MIIKRKSEIIEQPNPNLRGGKLVTGITDILDIPQMRGKGRLYAITRIPPGGSIGIHKHEGDFETYYILKGKARYSANDEIYEIGPGDMVQAEDGETHGIENIGDEDLEYIALVMYTKDKEI